MYVNYDDVEIGALDCDEIKGELDVDSSIFKMVADQFAKEKEQVNYQNCVIHCF